MDRKAFFCAVIGGVVGMVVGTFLTVAVCSVLPLGTITGGVVTCNSLRVVDEEGHTKVWLDASERGGRVEVYGKVGRAALSIGDHGGRVSVYGTGDSKSKVVMSVNEHGNGGVSSWDKNGYRLGGLSK